MRAFALVITAITNGDLTRKVALDAQDGSALPGETRELALTLNAMVDQMNVFACEVTRLSREIGTEGKLGGQAAVPGLTGTWADLVTNLNAMSANVTDDVRAITHAAQANVNDNTAAHIDTPMHGEWLVLHDAVHALIHAKSR